MAGESYLIDDPAAEHFYRVVAVGAPAVGAEALFPVPGGSLFEILSLFVRLTTSAVVANRRTQFVVSDGENNFLRLGSGVDVPASTAIEYSVGCGLPALTDNLSAVWARSAPLGRLILYPGATIRTVTQNIDVGDQYGALRCYVRETIIRSAQAETGREVSELAREQARLEAYS